MCRPKVFALLSVAVAGSFWIYESRLRAWDGLPPTPSYPIYADCSAATAAVAFYSNYGDDDDSDFDYDGDADYSYAHAATAVGGTLCAMGGVAEASVEGPDAAYVFSGFATADATGTAHSDAPQQTIWAYSTPDCWCEGRNAELSATLHHSGTDTLCFVEIDVSVAAEGLDGGNATAIAGAKFTMSHLDGETPVTDALIYIGNDSVYGDDTYYSYYDYNYGWLEGPVSGTAFLAVAAGVNQFTICLEALAHAAIDAEVDDASAAAEGSAIVTFEVGGY